MQARVRAAMDAQVLNEGRHQGGRTPYGYKVVDGGAHPNPSRAADGYRLKVLAIDDEVVDVVRRIFSEYLGGRGDRAIANGLNRDGIACPSARRPDQNRHRLADGWQGSTVRAILDNPRYTGYAFFGRWTRQETLLDPDDVVAGHVIRFRRSGAESVVRSRKPAHPEIVSVETFVEAQLRRRSRAAGGLAARRKLERGPKNSTKRAYPLRGRVRCVYCSRRMEGSPRGPRTYYRCSARTLVSGSAVLERHPKNVYLPEVPVVELLNAWLGGLFDRANRDRTVARLLESQRKGSSSNERGVVEQRLNDAERKLRRLQDAIKAGVDPMALVESVNEAQAERQAAQAELANAPKPDALTDADLHAMLDSLGDVGGALNRADPYKLQELYEKIGLEMTYDPDSRSVETAVNLGRRVSARVRGASCALTTRLLLPEAG